MKTITKRCLFSSSGFTLTETQLVVSIMALFVLIIVPNLKHQIDKAFDVRRKTDVHKIGKAFEDYYNDNSCYPALSVMGPCGGSQMKPYIQSMPCDPQINVPYRYIPQGTDPVDPQYLCEGYRLLAQMKDKTDLDIVAVGCSPINGCGYGSSWNWGIAVGGLLTAPGF